MPDIKHQGNILLVANWESNVGYAWWLMENFWITIACHFKKRGITSHLIYPKITKLPDNIAAADISVTECDFRDHTYQNLIVIHKLIRNNNITCIYLSDSPAYSFFYLYLRLCGIKTIIIHDHTPGERTIPAPARKTIKKIFHQLPFYTADHYIAVTDFVYQRLIEVNCIPPCKCSVAPNGINPINTDNTDMKYAYKIFSIPEDKTIVVTTGRASYYKRIDFFIECANKLINEQGLEKLHFLFCGDGPDIEDFKKLVSHYQLDKKFTFGGKRSDIRKILPSCQIGFHAATGEVGYSLSILEYMSAGLVTIVPDGPSTALATSHMDTGILYRVNDIQSATVAIHYALDNDTSNIRSNASRTIRNSYNITDTNSKLLAILDTACK